MADTAPVTKIYRIVVEGFDEAKAELGKMSAELEKLKKKKQETDKALATATNPKQVADLNKTIQAQVVLEADLTKRIAEKNREIKIGESLKDNTGAEGIGTAIQAYKNLQTAYKEAIANSQLMEAQFGKESTEAIEAARTAALYEAELIKINKLRSAPVKGTQEIPFTSNLAELEAEKASLKSTGTVVSEFDRKQAEAAISAREFGESQRVAAAETAKADDAIPGIVGSLDKYTGSLRQNLKAQIENAQAIAANKAAQKEINDAIKVSGTATDGQVNRLAALKEEALILETTNKTLTTTIRNQRAIAAKGSIEEGRAKINQLQQAYEQLSETERAQPFGQAIKADIDELEPKVKELEGTIGKFQRNVGNYPPSFTGAFKVLGKELDVLQGKLVNGNFKGKEFDELSKKTAVLDQVTKSLNTTFKTGEQESKAYKDAAKLIGATFGTDSEVFKTFAKEIGKGNDKLKETNQAFADVSNTGNKSVGVFKSMYSGLRQLANVIPGLGISGVLLLLIAPLQALATSIRDYFTAVDIAKEKTKQLSEVNIKSIEIYNKEVRETARPAFARDHSRSINERKEAIDQLVAKSPEYLGSLNLENIATKEGIKLTDDYTASLRKKAEAQAATTALTNATNVVANIRQEEEELKKLSKKGTVYYDDLSEAQQKFIDAKNFLGFRATASIVNARLDKGELNRVFTNMEDAIKKGEIKVTAAAEVFNDKLSESLNDPKKTKGLIEQLNTDIEKLTTQKTKSVSEVEIKSLNKQIEEKQKQLDLLNNKTTKTRVDRLTTDTQNNLKVVNATFQQEIAAETKRFNEIEKIHNASFDEEIVHYRNIENITKRSLIAKIALLPALKKSNAEEKAQRAEFGAQITSIELQTTQKIQEIEKKRFAEQNNNLKDNVANAVKAAKAAQQEITDNPQTSNLDRARATVKFMDEEIGQYEIYYAELLALNTQFSEEERRKVAAHIKDLQNERNRGLNDELVNAEKDMEIRNNNEITLINIRFARLREVILANDRLSARERQKQLDRLDRAQQRTILSKEVEQLTKETDAMFILFAKGLKSEEDYLKKKKELADKAAELAGKPKPKSPAERSAENADKPSDLPSLLGEGIAKLFHLGPAESSEATKAVVESFNLAESAMHAYYDAERQRIQDSLALNLQRLDLEQQQVKSRAQSQAEMDSIDKQYAAKKRDAEKQAGEETKKTRRAELKIALVAEIANIAVSAAKFGFPFGPIIFGVLSALALGRYALGVGQINAQQFEQAEVQKNYRGGVAKGRPHSRGGNPFKFKGVEYEDEVDELRIIRTRNAPKNKVYTITGNQQQIASKLNVIGGGVEFARGAKLKMFAGGGMLGGNLQAPVFTPASQTNVYNNNAELVEKLDQLRIEMNQYSNETSKRIDRLQVVQVTHTVTKAMQKEVQQKAIGTL